MYVGTPRAEIKFGNFRRTSENGSNGILDYATARAIKLRGFSDFRTKASNDGTTYCNT